MANKIDDWIFRIRIFFFLSEYRVKKYAWHKIHNQLTIKLFQSICVLCTVPSRPLSTTNRKRQREKNRNEKKNIRFEWFDNDTKSHKKVTLHEMPIWIGFWETARNWHASKKNNIIMDAATETTTTTNRSKLSVHCIQEQLAAINYYKIVFKTTTMTTTLSFRRHFPINMFLSICLYVLPSVSKIVFNALGCGIAFYDLTSSFNCYGFFFISFSVSFLFVCIDFPMFPVWKCE